MTLTSIERYNQSLRQTLDSALQKVSFSDPALPLLHDGYALHVALEHRLMHAETFAYMLHQLPLECKLRQNQVSPVAGPPAAPRMVKIPAGVATLGMPRNEGDAFGWDNEFEAQRVTVPEFAMDVYNVTNGQFLEFMRAGGYRDRSLWTDSDWEGKTARGIEHPLPWTLHGDRWSHRAMFEYIPLPLAWPA